MQGIGGASLYIPLRAITSAKFSPEYSTFMSISPAPASGTGTSRISKADVLLPFLTRKIAFM
jgi:hypothetical protein